MKGVGPTIKRGKSKQDHCTPPEFIKAVSARFGPIQHDLAATKKNAVDGLGDAGWFYSPEDDSLAQRWDDFEWGSTLWLNPPFHDIAPWASKCEEVRFCRNWLLFLVPASVDANWYIDHVHHKAFVMPLAPRLIFQGEKDPYPRGLILAAFGFGVHGFEPWRWKM